MFDRTREDTSNIVMLEHVNLTIPDQALATLFYVKGLGLTRDPYMMVELDNMWINAGRMQFHLPSRGGAAQRLSGRIGLVLPDLDALESRLGAVAPRLAGTGFTFRRSGSVIEATCPWGNCFTCHAPDTARWGPMTLGLAYVSLDVAPGAARAVAAFYEHFLAAPATLEAADDGLFRAAVRIGADQRLLFTETRAAIPDYDGHHVQVYMADFSGPYRRLLEHGLVSRETDAHEWRFIDIVDPQSGTLACRLEHEVRSLRHPLYGRPLINRNPAQTNRDYRRGQDAFVGPT